MSALRPLILDVKRSGWRSDGEYESKKASWEITRKGVLERDNFSCVYCGFSAKKYQDVHHLDGDHTNDDQDNLVTACKLCHATKHIGKAGMDRRATLIYYPEMDQAHLNWLVRWIALGPFSGVAYTAYMNAPKSALFDHFRHRHEYCREWVGTSDVVTLANQIINMPDAVYERFMVVKMSAMRLFPGTFNSDGSVSLLSGYSDAECAAWKEHMDHLVPDSSAVEPYLKGLSA